VKVNDSSKTVHKVKIRKTKIRFPLPYLYVTVISRWTYEWNVFFAAKMKFVKLNIVRILSRLAALKIRKLDIHIETDSLIYRTLSVLLWIPFIYALWDFRILVSNEKRQLMMKVTLLLLRFPLHSVFILLVQSTLENWILINKYSKSLLSQKKIRINRIDLKEDVYSFTLTWRPLLHDTPGTSLQRNIRYQSLAIAINILRRLVVGAGIIQSQITLVQLF
jgi:hypothetical protein